MNIILNLNNINSYNVCFLEPKKNIIMDGLFTKMNFLNDYLTMNGIFIIFPIDQYSIENNEKKYYLKFKHTSNMRTVQEFSKLENNLLELYNTNHNKNKKKSLLLSKQLYNGYIKIYKENVHIIHDKLQLVMKISGIWENNTEIGLTYKLFLSQEYI
jgi:hypothetical protein